MKWLEKEKEEEEEREESQTEVEDGSYQGPRGLESRIDLGGVMTGSTNEWSQLSLH